MKQVKIFVEGIADEKFLEDYLNHVLPEFEITNETIVKAKGWENINSELNRGILGKNTDEGGVNIVVFDADGNFKERKSQLETWRDANHLSFELFLLPNNQDAGTLESVLENIIQPQNQSIFDCWEGYEKCLRSKGEEERGIPFTLPAKKTKIYGYLEALLGESRSEKEKIKEKERDYRNVDHWNLDAEYLKPLKDFLLTCLHD